MVNLPHGAAGVSSLVPGSHGNVLHSIQNIIIYIDNVIIHTATHEHHLQFLDDVLQQLDRNHLKINLAKYFFRNTKVAYLGFVLTPKGIRPVCEKLQMLCNMLPPTNVHQVWQFIGLCNFFRKHIKDFAWISQPLHWLNPQKAPSTPILDIPKDAIQAFYTIRDALISEPVAAFPRADWKFALVSEANQPSSLQKGCMSASLCQIDEHGSFHVLSHASRQFLNHEANYLPFLLDIANALYGVNPSLYTWTARTVPPPQENKHPSACCFTSTQLCDSKQDRIRSSSTPPDAVKDWIQYLTETKFRRKTKFKEFSCQMYSWHYFLSHQTGSKSKQLINPNRNNLSSSELCEGKPVNYLMTSKRKIW